MTVRLVKKKEFGGMEPASPQMDGGYPDQGLPGKRPEDNMGGDEVGDHTHPEYDQLLVKIQELEQAVQNMLPGGIQQEGLDEGRPEDDKGKPTGNEIPPGNLDNQDMLKRLEAAVKKVEDLTGVPERDIGKQLNPAGPDNINSVPQTVQPASGEAPSGGGFDSNDKTNRDDGDDAEGKASNPAGYDKLPIQKNRLRMSLAKRLIGRARKLIREANDPDPSQPNPGAYEKDQAPMDGAVDNKSPTGGTEATGDADGEASENPEANTPNEQRPIMKEEAPDFLKKDDDEEDGDEEKSLAERTYNSLLREIQAEKTGISGRKSMVGMTAKSNKDSLASQQEFLSAKERSSASIKEYLVKAGHGQALGHMTPITG